MATRHKLTSTESIFENILPIAKFKEVNNCSVRLLVKTLTKNGKTLKIGDKTAFAVLTLDDGSAESIAVSRKLIPMIESNSIDASTLYVGTQDDVEIVFSNVLSGISV